MPSLTALLHTFNDGLRLGRALETLHPCDQIMIVDHGSRDATIRIAREYGARIVVAKPGAISPEVLSSADHLPICTSSWLFCLDPRESITERLAAGLFEWKTEEVTANQPFAVWLREETREGWVENPTPQTRLVPANWKHWGERFPANTPSAQALEGNLLRFNLP